MGQQQLLLLVLSTVIVGLATVAGIQAFSENQAQASQDALVQRGTSIASDIQGLAGKPTQMGGIDLSNSVGGGKIAKRLGYETTGNGGSNAAQVNADGAGTDGTCTINQSSSSSVTIGCTSSDAPQKVEVTVTPGTSDPVSTSFTSP